MGKYFGTDGIRGSYGDELIHPDFAYRLGSALGLFLARRKPGLPLNVVIGRDTRPSGPALSAAITRGLNRRDVYVHDAGIVPTPAVAHAVLEQRADLGISVTASHNPATDNGIKLFDHKGHKLDDEREQEIEALVDEQPARSDNADLPPAKAYEIDAAAVYTNSIRSLMHQNCLRGWKVALDLANGATCATTPGAFRHWGAKLQLIGDSPDGVINDGLGSERPQALGRLVRKHRANIGVAHDGDGDRLVVCDEQGQIVDGDILLGLFGIYALRAGALRANTLVVTVHSNLGLDHAIRAAGGQVERTAVGDRNIARRMRELGANIGGESSGHVIFSDFATTGDGLLAAAKLVELIRKTGQPLSKLRKEIELFPQRTLNLPIAAKLPIEGLKKLPQAIQKATADFGAEGRVLVRYSGTEPQAPPPRRRQRRQDRG